MSARRKDGLINDANIDMIRAARGRSEEELLHLAASHIGQVAAGSLCGRSQSWASRHLNGGAGLERNKLYMRTYRDRMKNTLPKLDDETKIRMLAERLALEMAPLFEGLENAIFDGACLISDSIATASLKTEAATRGIAVKLDTANTMNRR